MRSGTDIGQVTEPTPPRARVEVGGGMAGADAKIGFPSVRPSFFPSLFPLLDTEGGLLIRRMIINTRDRGREEGAFSHSWWPSYGEITLYPLCRI